MKKLSTYVAGAAVGLMGTMAQAADDVTLQLKWVTQAQFAGYYVAQDKGFYEEEDLNVTIKPGGPDIAPTQVLAGGRAREGPADGEHRATVQILGHDADLPQGRRDRDHG